MAWTYTDPATSNRDWIRLKLGDTRSDDPQLSDEEIASLLTDAGGSKWQALLEAIRAVMAKYSRLVDTSREDGASDSYSQRLAQYEALYKRYENRRPVLAAYAGGISKADKDAAVDEADRVAPFAYRDQFTHPGTEDDGEADE